MVIYFYLYLVPNEAIIKHVCITNIRMQVTIIRISKFIVINLKVIITGRNGTENNNKPRLIQKDFDLEKYWTVSDAIN